MKLFFSFVVLFKNTNRLCIHVQFDYQLQLNGFTHCDNNVMGRSGKEDPQLLQKRDSKALAPRFPKPKDEGWFAVLGEIETREVIALKRVGFIRGRSSTQLAFFTPETTGRVIYTLYLMSDCYLGLDQQYDVCLDVIPASLEAQVRVWQGGAGFFFLFLDLTLTPQI